MVFLIVVCMLCGIDIGIKCLVEKKVDKKKSYFRDKIEISKHHNKGVFLNHFDEYPKTVTAVTGAIVGVLVCLFAIMMPKKRSKLLKAGFAIALGGALGNSLDRIHRGYVVDYVNCPKVPILKKIIFNFADVCILAGSIFIFIGTLLEEE